jgi:hypothetical protein
MIRPVYKQFSADFGVWGAAQRGVQRLDAGPRVSMRVRPGVRVHVDYRQKLGRQRAAGVRPGPDPGGGFIERLGLASRALCG